MKKLTALALILALVCTASTIFASPLENFSFDDLLAGMTSVEEENSDIEEVSIDSCPSILYEPMVDSAITTDAYCSHCGYSTASEYCSIPGDYDYQYCEIDHHDTYSYYEIVCTTCNSRYGRYTWYKTPEAHVWSATVIDACILCEPN